MVDIDVSKLKRDKDYIKSILSIKNNVLTTKKDIAIFIPARYENKELLMPDVTISTLAVFGIVDMEANKYAIMNIPTFINLTPFLTDISMIGEYKYMVLFFEKNDVVCENTNLVKKETFIFNIFNEFILNGSIPWFMNEQDIASLLDGAEKYAGSKVGRLPKSMEV